MLSFVNTQAANGQFLFNVYNCHPQCNEFTFDVCPLPLWLPLAQTHICRSPLVVNWHPSELVTLI